MILSNPKIDGQTHPLTTLLANLPKSKSGTYMFAGTKKVPDWRGINNHFQGIAPINGYTMITGNISASADDWWCASFEGYGDPGMVTAVVTTSYYDHAGGIQRLGDLLPIPLENDNGEATVAFYDVSAMHTPRWRYEIHVASKASAVAITNYTDSLGAAQALIFIYQYNPKKFYVYRTSNVSVDENNWTYIGETNEIPDPDENEQFQCFALCTQANAGDDTVYLLGFRENEAISLFTVDLGSTNYGGLTHVRTYEGFSGAEWRYGVGLQICSPTQIRIFGCSEDPSGSETNYTFPIYYWG